MFKSLLALLTLTAYASAGVLDHSQFARGLDARHGKVARKVFAEPRLTRRRESLRCKTREAVQVSISVDVPEPTPTKEPKPEEPTKEPEPEWTPEPTTKEPKPATTKEPKPEPTKETGGGGGGGGGGFLAGTNTGETTFYNTGMTACGIFNTDDEYIAAVSIELFYDYPGFDGANPNNNPLCGKKVKANYQGKSVTVAITDACVGCAYFDLDMTPTAFNQISSPDAGRISGVTWTWA